MLNSFHRGDEIYHRAAPSQTRHHLGLGLPRLGLLTTLEMGKLATTRHAIKENFLKVNNPNARAEVGDIPADVNPEPGTSTLCPINRCDCRYNQVTKHDD